MAYQTDLFPLPIIEVEPADLGAARCKEIGLGVDGLRYYLKRDIDGGRVRASEMLCTELAGAVHMAVPVPRIAILPDRSTVFASREECGFKGLASWFETIVGERPVPEPLVRQFSAWLAVDAFVHNPDRHIDNFLIYEEHGPRVLGIDFSEALLTNDWPPPPLLPRCTTIRYREVMADKLPLREDAFSELLDRLEALPEGWMERAVGGLPDGWLDPAASDAVRQWWATERRLRIAEIRSGVRDGHYF